MKAYEFIAELDRLYGPSYRASPGGVYPALTALVEERLLLVRRDGRANRYALSERGRKALDDRRRVLTELEARTGVGLTAAVSLLPHLEGFTTRVMKLSGLVDGDLVAEILERAADEIESLERSHVPSS